MRKTLTLILAIALTICVIPQNTAAQNTQDLHLQHSREGSEDETTRLWDVKTDTKPRKMVARWQNILSIAFSPDSKTLAGGTVRDTVYLWNVQTGKSFRKLTVHKSSVVSVAFSPDGKILVSGCFDKTLVLWDTKTGKSLPPLIGHIFDPPIIPVSNVAASYVAFSPDGKTLASAINDGSIYLLDTQTGKRIKTLALNWVPFTSIAFSPEGSRLATGF